jgi:hypothetical protein
MFHGILKKQNGKFTYLDPGEKLKHDLFLKSLPEGTTIEVYIEAVKHDKSVAQLAKVHAMIRELANFLGYTFEEMKNEVKEKAGLSLVEEINGSQVKIYKSFANCSKTELNMAINACIEIGDVVGFNLH